MYKIFFFLIFVVSSIATHEKIKNSLENFHEEVSTDKNYKESVTKKNRIRKILIEPKINFKSLPQKTKYNGLENYQEILDKLNEIKNSTFDRRVIKFYTYVVQKYFLKTIRKEQKGLFSIF